VGGGTRFEGRARVEVTLRLHGLVFGVIIPRLDSLDREWMHIRHLYLSSLLYARFLYTLLKVRQQGS
jgi:hypothetical protein